MGISQRSDMPVALVRSLAVLATLVAGFAASAVLGGFATLMLGIGVLAYLVCWLVLPSDADDASDTENVPPAVQGLASAALMLAAAAGLGGLALLGGIAALFGFGWAVAVAVAALVVGTLVSWPALRPAWVLPPLAVLALAATVVAASDVRIEPTSKTKTERPASVAALPADGYRAGLGDLLVDLRALRPAKGTTVPIRIDAGTGRTIVALPTDRCLAVAVDSRTTIPGGDLVDAVGRRFADGFGESSVFFGEPQFGDGRWSRASRDPQAPTIQIDFRSIRGSLWVRDYPAGVDPLGSPRWPDTVDQHPPPAPDERRPEWQESPDNPPRVKRLWRTWKRDFDRHILEQDRRRAGSCAPSGIIR